MHKNDFPIFANNPDLVYLDSAATVQKPAAVIDGIAKYLSNNYANVHRGDYELSQRSEELFFAARRIVAEWINAADEEVVFTSSGTDSVNLLAQSMELSTWIGKDDTIVLCESAHHANIVPWQMLAERVGCTIEWVGVTDEGQIDSEMLKNICLLNKSVRLVACSMVSNVAGVLNDIAEIKRLCGESVYVVVDASQSITHTEVDCTTLGCDFLFFTGHKLGAHTGIGVLRGKKEHMQALVSPRGGGGAISSVSKQGYTLQGSPDKFEPGTPNLVGVSSLHYALEYLKEIGGGSKLGFYNTLATHEETLISYSLKQFAGLEKYGVRLIGGAAGRTGLFSFLLPEKKSSAGLGRYMATKNIAIRCGGQCAHPYHASLASPAGSCRVSYRLYTEMSDVILFFEIFEERLQK